MSGSQVFYMGENGEVILWDGTIKVDPAAPGPAITDYKTLRLPNGDPLYVDATTPGSIDFDIGYAAAIKDVLAQIIVAGKQNLVQWLEQKLELLP